MQFLGRATPVCIMLCVLVINGMTNLGARQPELDCSSEELPFRCPPGWALQSYNSASGLWSLRGSLISEPDAPEIVVEVENIETMLTHNPHRLVEAGYTTFERYDVPIPFSLGVLTGRSAQWHTPERGDSSLYAQRSTALLTPTQRDDNLWLQRTVVLDDTYDLNGVVLTLSDNQLTFRLSIVPFAFEDQGASLLQSMVLSADDGQLVPVAHLSIRAPMSSTSISYGNDCRTFEIRVRCPHGWKINSVYPGVAQLVPNAEDMGEPVLVMTNDALLTLRPEGLEGVFVASEDVTFSTIDVLFALGVGAGIPAIDLIFSTHIDPMSSTAIYPPQQLGERLWVQQSIIASASTQAVHVQVYDGLILAQRWTPPSDVELTIELLIQVLSASPPP